MIVNNVLYIQTPLKDKSYTNITLLMILKFLIFNFNQIHL